MQLVKFLTPFRFSLRHWFIGFTMVAVLVGLHFSTVSGLDRYQRSAEQKYKNTRQPGSKIEIAVETNYVAPGLGRVEVSFGGTHGFTRYYVDLFGFVIRMPKSRVWIS